MSKYANIQQQDQSAKIDLSSSHSEKTVDNAKHKAATHLVAGFNEHQIFNNDRANSSTISPDYNFGHIPIRPKDTSENEEPARELTSINSNKVKMVQAVQSSASPATIRTHHNVVLKQFTATIPQSDKSVKLKNRPAYFKASDSVGEVGQNSVVIEEEEGMMSIRESDSITPNVTYTPAITNTTTAPGPTEFGVTIARPTITGIVIAHDTTAHAFNVTATLNNSITWSIQSLTRTNIPNETAAGINAGNYTTVASDLTPNMSSDNGRPPRTLFWAEDLTRQHELFHANEFANTYGNPAFAFAQTWLTAQTATTEAEARALVDLMPRKVIDSYLASYMPASESRAYGDGAPLYLARANAITARGVAGSYPAAPAPPAAPRP